MQTSRFNAFRTNNEIGYVLDQSRFSLEDYYLKTIFFINMHMH